MKKIVLTIAIVLGLSLTTFAEPNGGGLFHRGANNEVFQGTNWRDTQTRPILPPHGQSNNQNAPLGSGIAALVGFGVAYLVSKRRKEN